MKITLKFYHHDFSFKKELSYYNYEVFEFKKPIFDGAITHFVLKFDDISEIECEVELFRYEGERKEHIIGGVADAYCKNSFKKLEIDIYRPDLTFKLK